MTRVQIDDAEPSHPEANIRANKKSLIVRAAVDDGVAHAPHVFRSDRTAIEAQDSRNAAHGLERLGG